METHKTKHKPNHAEAKRRRHPPSQQEMQRVTNCTNHTRRVSHRERYAPKLETQEREAIRGCAQ